MLTRLMFKQHQIMPAAVSIFLVILAHKETAGFNPAAASLSSIR